MAIGERVLAEALWDRMVGDASGRYLGTVEALAFGRGGHIRKIGIRLEGSGRTLRFLPVDGMRLEGDWIFVAPSAVADVIQLTEGGPKR